MGLRDAGASKKTPYICSNICICIKNDCISKNKKLHSVLWFALSARMIVPLMQSRWSATFNRYLHRFNFWHHLHFMITQCFTNSTGFDRVISCRGVNIYENGVWSSDSDERLKVRRDWSIRYCETIIEKTMFCYKKKVFLLWNIIVLWAEGLLPLGGFYVNMRERALRHIFLAFFSYRCYSLLRYFSSMYCNSFYLHISYYIFVFLVYCQ